MTLRITKLNVSGFSADQGQATDQTYVNSAYETIDSFSIDITFEGMYEQTAASADGTTAGATTYVYANAVDVTSTFDWASIGLTYSKPNAYTVRLVGPGINVFTNQFYKFKMEDLSEQVLQPNTTLPFLSLIQYKMPSTSYTMKTYPFSVRIPAASAAADPLLGGGGYNAGPYYNNGTLIAGTTTVENVDMKQWFYWAYSVASANIASIRARGLK